MTMMGPRSPLLPPGILSPEIMVTHTGTSLEEISQSDISSAIGLVQVLAVPPGAVGALKAPPQPTTRAPKPPKLRVTKAPKPTELRVTKAPKPPKLRVTKAPKPRVTET